MKPRPPSLREPPHPEPIPTPISVWIAQTAFAALVIVASVVFIALVLRLGPCDFDNATPQQMEELP